MQIPNSPPDPHLIFEVISAAVAVGWLIVGLLIKSSLGGIKLAQQKDKAELVANQNDVKEHLTSNNSNTQRDLAVHIAQCDTRFIAVGQTLQRIDSKLDKIT